MNRPKLLPASLPRTCLLALCTATLTAAAQTPFPSIPAPVTEAPSATLPNAPSAVLYARPGDVNGRPYRRPTRREDLIAYRHELIGARPFISAAIRSGIEQARTVPTGWGQDFPGYAQRYGSAYAEFAIDSSVRYGLAAASHEDVRYLICHHCTPGKKVANAVLAELTARHGADGHRTLSPTPIIAGMSGPLIAYTAWYPPGYGPGDAAGHAAFGFGFRILGHIAREFLFDKDNPRALTP